MLTHDKISRIECHIMEIVFKIFLVEKLKQSLSTSTPFGICIWGIQSGFFLEIRHDLVGRNKVGSINI